MRTVFAFLLLLPSIIIVSCTSRPDTAGEPARPPVSAPDSGNAGSALSVNDTLQRGIGSYRSGRFEDAASDFKAAAQSYLSTEAMQSYVNSGRFEHLDRLETALVYLALAQSKLGKEDDARETVLRLLTAERIGATYAKLPLTADVAEFETLAPRLVPNVNLPRNVQLAGGITLTPPPVSVATTTTGAPASTVAQAAVTTDASADQRRREAEMANRQRMVDDLVAQERVKIRRDAEERIAAERVVTQRATDERIAAERAAIEKAARDQVASAQKSADERVAAERAAIARTTEQRITAERAAVQKSADERAAAAQSEVRAGWLDKLRRADTQAANGQANDANATYRSIANSNAPRDVIAAAAIGLYRTGDFDNAVMAFRKLGTFARGEEDLRYYDAVSLYETGNYGAAQKELACALPFLQITDDVSRYRSKIEKTATQQALR